MVSDLHHSAKTFYGEDAVAGKEEELIAAKFYKKTHIDPKYLIVRARL